GGHDRARTRNRLLREHALERAECRLGAPPGRDLLGAAHSGRKIIVAALEPPMTADRHPAFAILPRLLLTLGIALPTAARSAEPTPPPSIVIKRAEGPITLDGELSDPGWQGVDPITTWFETNPGDNVEPKVKSAAYLAYDDEYFYAGFLLQDPQPRAIR